VRYLVVSEQNSPIPPEMAPGLFAAMKAFSAGSIASGKAEQTWGFAGVQGGGAILNVESPEELDAIMAEFPFGPFSRTTIYSLVDLNRSLDNASKAFGAMMGGMAAH